MVEVGGAGGGGEWWRSIDLEQNRKTAPVLGKYIVDFEFIKEVTMIKTANRSRFTEVYSRFEFSKH